MTVRAATDADFIAFFDKPAPEIWVGMCGVVDGVVVGMGGVVYSEQGVAVGFLDATARPSFALHRAGLRFLKVMRDVGETHIITYCDGDIQRAASWLKRLGFTMSTQKLDGENIWEWRAAAPSFEGRT